jgi:hypothetical protein
LAGQGSAAPDAAELLRELPRWRLLAGWDADTTLQQTGP